MKAVFFFASILFGTYSFAQCNAGLDRTSCPDDPDANAVQLGGNPTASFGTGPYTYSWTTNPYMLSANLVLHASDLLSDTASSNPTILDRTPRSLTFFLQVTDALGATCYDTVTVAFSNFAISTGMITHTIALGDSVYLASGSNIAGSNYPVTTFQWEPSASLSQSNLQSGFWAKPTASTYYSVMGTDSLGCSVQAPPYYHVVVNQLSTAEPENRADAVIFPNPANEYVQIKLPTSVLPMHYTLTNASGQVVLSNKEVPQQLDISKIPAGTYILEVIHSGGTVRQKLTIDR